MAGKKEEDNKDLVLFSREGHVGVISEVNSVMAAYALYRNCCMEHHTSLYGAIGVPE